MYRSFFVFNRYNDQIVTLIIRKLIDFFFHNENESVQIFFCFESYLSLEYEGNAKNSVKNLIDIVIIGMLFIFSHTTIHE